MRRDFEVPGEPAEATISVTARGVYALFVNDVRIDSAALSPRPRSDDRVGFQTFDVAAHLHRGANVIGLILGAGWNGETPPALALLLELQLTDTAGRQLTISSDTAFRCTTGAIIFSRPSVGERQEHVLREAGWKLPRFDDGAWHDVRVSADQGSGESLERADERAEVVGVVAAVRILHTNRGDDVVDFGRVVVGRVVVTFTAPTGTEVRLDHIVELDDRGEISAEHLSGTDVFVSAGTIDEVFEPGFSVHTFRYIRVSGLAPLLASAFSAWEISLGSDRADMMPGGGTRNE